MTRLLDILAYGVIGGATVFLLAMAALWVEHLPSGPMTADACQTACAWCEGRSATVTLSRDNCAMTTMGCSTTTIPDAPPFDENAADLK